MSGCSSFPLRRALAAGVAASVLSFAQPAAAVRPFITDDARVVGNRSIQLETWLRLDPQSFQHWVLVGFGPIGPLELTVGGVQGASAEELPARYGASGPLVQAKALLWSAAPNRWPGLAVVGGAVPPIGTGALQPGGWDFFEYVALTESLGHSDQVLLHLNVGIFGSTDESHGTVLPTWGVGTQVRVHGALHGVAEVFSGDPYAGSASGATQVGFRYIASQTVQVDGTVGTGLWGQTVLPTWGTIGLRLASSALW